MHAQNSTLVFNCGSSSIKLALYGDNISDGAFFRLSMTNIGMPDTTLWIKGEEETTNNLGTLRFSDASARVVREVKDRFPDVAIVGHRIVHGGKNYAGPVELSESVIAELVELIDYDAQHMPASLEIVRLAKEAFPGVKNIACFDTAFFHDLPRVAQLLPIPRRFEAMGMRRYGFHGLSYTYLMRSLEQKYGTQTAQSRVILAHLGSGVSVTALSGGKPVDTTMSLTPNSGVPMSTRSGDIDPGVFMALQKSTGMDLGQIHNLLGLESGLKGISEQSADMYPLLESMEHDERSRDAVELFCYEVKKAIGSLSATMGGVDVIVISGGMGENAPRIRERILWGLEYLGVVVHNDNNHANQEVISTDDCRVKAIVLHTDENQIIAEQSNSFIQANNQ